MQTTSNATLFQTSYSEALGAYRARKAVHTSGLVSPSTTSGDSWTKLDAKARYGYPIHLHPNFQDAVISNPDDLAVEGSGADGGRYRVLSMQVDAQGWIWTSEAGGVVRQIDAESGVTVAVYKGAKAPVPSFDFVETQGGERLLVTGSWDKAIRVYRTASARLGTGTDKDTPAGSTAASVNVRSPAPLLTLANAMSDFIKCVHVFCSDSNTYIATAGSDKSIMIWDASALLALTPCSAPPSTLACVHQCKVHLRPVNALCSLVGLDGITRLYSADSMGRILESTLNACTRRLEVQREVRGFSTAVYDLKAGWRRIEVEAADVGLDEDAFVSKVHEDQQGTRFQLVAEIWGASGDKSAAGYRLSALVRCSTTNAMPSRSGTNAVLGTQAALEVATVKIAHDDFVKAVLPLGLHWRSHAVADEYADAVVTGGSDEHVRMFVDASASDQRHVHVVEAHWHEVSALALWKRTRATTPRLPSVLPPPSAQAEAWIVSASLDGSVRRFALHTIAALDPPQLARPIDAVSTASQTWDRYSVPAPAPAPAPAASALFDTSNPRSVHMTPDEEAELAELMDSDSD